MPYDADLTRLATSSLSSAEIVRLLGALPAKRQVCLIDACHAGGIGATKNAAGAIPKGFGDAGARVLAQGSGRAILTSSREDEQSAILVGDRNSLFTTVLLEALNGAVIDRGDGVIGVLDVFGYVADEVVKRSSQHPILHAGRLDGNFALGRRPPTPTEPVVSLNDLAGLFSALYPKGPLHDDLWLRAGGDVARLVLSGTGRAQWHSALHKVLQGGGGLKLHDLLAIARQEYPGHPDLTALSSGDLRQRKHDAMGASAAQPKV